ncbi:MAG: MBL fold metallo-hydrolase [Clostridia bacterium]|nr:MBL fold metallo-hydrolase [Clostridia bacterium]
MSEMRTVITERIQTGPLMVNTYVAYAQGADSCVVIDPADAAPIKKYAETYGLKIAAVLLTHCHFDHILGVPELVQDGARLYIGENDAAGLNDRSVSLCFMELPEMKPDVLLKDGDTINEAGLSISVISTPGHTAGGVCYVLKETSTIFAGDTLFRRSIGRTDLPGGDYEALISSIKNKLFVLEGDYAVNPGHDRGTTLEEERQSNPYAGRGARW